tara:strand:+ start:186 stop:395 length:210 start_codon:yes stop_codon:yes gene_type:complete
MEETNSINIKQEDLKILAQVNPGAWIQLENIVLKRQQQELMNQIQIMGTEKVQESNNGVVNKTHEQKVK